LSRPAEEVRQIIVPCDQQLREWLAEAEGVARDTRVRTCAGGATRAESVYQAVLATGEHIEWLAIHDAARPLVSQQLIDRIFGFAFDRGAAVAPALPVG